MATLKQRSRRALCLTCLVLALLRLSAFHPPPRSLAPSPTFSLSLTSFKHPLSLFEPRSPLTANAGRSRYIDTAAQHAANKGRGGIAGGGGGGNGGIGGGGGGSGGGRGGGGSNLAGLRSSPVYLPDSLSQAIYVPTQKITTLHPGVGAGAVAVATAMASAAATAAAGASEGGLGGLGGADGTGGGEDDVDVRLRSPALTANPALLQSVTGEVRPIGFMRNGRRNSCPLLFLVDVDRVGMFMAPAPRLPKPL